MPQPRSAPQVRSAAAMLAAGFAAAAVCGGVVTAATPANAAPTDPASEIIGLTNDARDDVGAAPVMHSDDLQATAQAWAQHLADSSTFRHNPSVGDQLPSGWSTWGENIAMGTSAAPSSMHEMWMRSPGHYRNLTNADFNVMGVGYATAADGTVYGVEVFGHYADPAVVGAETVQTGLLPVDETEAPPEVPTATPEEPADPPATPEPVADPPSTDPATVVDEPVTTAAPTPTTAAPTATLGAAAPSTASPVGALAGSTDPQSLPALHLVVGAALAGGVSIAAFAAHRRSRRS